MRAWAVLALSLAACGRDDKPAPNDATADARLEAAALASDASAPVVDAAPEAPTTPADDALPEANASLTVRAKHLLEAISKNSPDLAQDILFPRDAYSLARDEKDPAKSWDNKVKPGFDKATGHLSKHIKGVERAAFVSIDLGKQVARVTPKKGEWKDALYRVKNSTLSFTVDGKQQRIEIVEMVGWRGNWYVTKLR